MKIYKAKVGKYINKLKSIKYKKCENILSTNILVVAYTFIKPCTM